MPVWARAALNVCIDAGHDFQQRGFAGAVEAENADFGAVEEGQGNILENVAPAGNHLADAVHGEDILHKSSRLEKGPILAEKAPGLGAGQALPFGPPGRKTAGGVMQRFIGGGVAVVAEALRFAESEPAGRADSFC